MGEIGRIKLNKNTIMQLYASNCTNDDENDEIMKRKSVESLRSFLDDFEGSSRRGLVAWSLQQHFFTFFFFKSKGEWPSRILHLQLEVTLT